MAELSNLSTTWNNGSTTFSGFKLNVTDTASAAASLLVDLQIGSTSQFKVTKTGLVQISDGSASAPAYSFTGDTDTGFYRSSSNSIGVSRAGSLAYLFGSLFQVYGTYFSLADSAGSNSVQLHRHTANRLALRNGTNGQSFEINETYTDDSNRGGLLMQSTSSGHYINSIANGTATGRDIIFRLNSADRWQVAWTGGHLLASSNNSVDIGSGSNDPRNIYVGTSVLNADGSAAAPSYSFGSDTDTGMYSVSANQLGFATAGAIRANINGGTSFQLYGNHLVLSDSAGTSATRVYTDAANTLAQRNGTSAQEQRWYGTYSDASNYERASISYSGANYILAVQAAGTGTARNLAFETSGTLRWRVTTDGHFATVADNTYDIGSGSNDPRNIYVGTSVLNADGSAAAPAYSFAGDTDTGMYRSTTAGKTGLSFSTAGTDRFWISDVTGALLGWTDNTVSIGTSGNYRPSTIFAAQGLYAQSDSGFLAFGSSNDVVLRRDAANTLAQRNGANGQAHRIYSFYTDGSNNEYQEHVLDSNIHWWRTRGNGTGSFRVAGIEANDIRFYTGSSSPATFRWYFSSSGHFLAATDNTYDIGASGATRPRTLYIGTNIRTPQLLITDSSNTSAAFLNNGGANILEQRNSTLAQTLRIYGTYTDASNYERLDITHTGGNVELYSRAAGTGTTTNLNIGTIGAAKFGIVTNSTARWQVDSSGHFLAEADNTYDIGASGANRPRNIYAGTALIVPDGVTAPSATSGDAKIFVDSADGDLKIIFGDGTTKTIVTDT